MGNNIVYQDQVYLESITQDSLKNRRIWVNDEINEQSVTKVIYMLSKIEKIDNIKEIPMEDRESIEIICNSPGGLCYQGFFLISVIEDMVKRGYKIITTTGGISCSMSFLIGLVGSHRRGYKYSAWLCHQPSGGMIGEAVKLKRESDELERLWELSKTIIKEYTKIDDGLLNKIYHETYDYFFDSKIVLELGIVDEII